MPHPLFRDTFKNFREDEQALAECKGRHADNHCRMNMLITLRMSSPSH